jgi:type IV secretion system protein TrbF
MALGGKKKQKSPDNPQILARRTWDFQIVRSYKELWFWRILAVVGMSGFVLVTVISWSHMQQPKLVPYVVTVTPDGRPEFRGVVSSQTLEINDAVVRNYLMRFVENMRSVSTDTIVVRRRLQDLYWIATPAAQSQLTEYIQNSDVFEMSMQERRRDIQFVSFERQAESLWRVEWVEHVRNAGVLVEQVPMSGTFAYVQALPEGEIEAENNPFGLFFDEFNIAQLRVGG